MNKNAPGGEGASGGGSNYLKSIFPWSQSKRKISIVRKFYSIRK
jgi:hypothetical protein